MSKYCSVLNMLFTVQYLCFSKTEIGNYETELWNREVLCSLVYENDFEFE